MHALNSVNYGIDMWINKVMEDVAKWLGKLEKELKEGDGVEE